MSPLDADIVAEKAMAVERHLDRVADRLPPTAAELRPSTDESDAVVLHLWQATQIVIDVATALCVQLRLGTPASYADAFRKLEASGVIDAELGGRLVKAAGFRNVVAHAYEELDMIRLFQAASEGPADLRLLLGRARDALRGS